MAKRIVALAALTSLAAIAHPETAEGHFRDRVEEAYRTIYGKDVTDAQLDSILESAANAGSDRYAALFD